MRHDVILDKVPYRLYPQLFPESGQLRHSCEAANGLAEYHPGRECQYEHVGSENRGGKPSTPFFASLQDGIVADATKSSASALKMRSRSEASELSVFRWQ